MTNQNAINALSEVENVINYIVITKAKANLHDLFMKNKRKFKERVFFTTVSSLP